MKRMQFPLLTSCEHARGQEEMGGHGVRGRTADAIRPARWVRSAALAHHVPSCNRKSTWRGRTG